MGFYLNGKELQKRSPASKLPGIPIDPQVFLWLPRKGFPSLQVTKYSYRSPSVPMAAQEGFPQPLSSRYLLYINVWGRRRYNALLSASCCIVLHCIALHCFDLLCVCLHKMSCPRHLCVRVSYDTNPPPATTSWVTLGAAASGRFGRWELPRKTWTGKRGTPTRGEPRQPKA